MQCVGVETTRSSLCFFEPVAFPLFLGRLKANDRISESLREEIEQLLTLRQWIETTAGTDALLSPAPIRWDLSTKRSLVQPSAASLLGFLPNLCYCGITGALFVVPDCPQECTSARSFTKDFVMA